MPAGLSLRTVRSELLERRRKLPSLAQSPALADAALLRRLAFAGVLLAFIVVVLGAYVRLTAAGLGCPDWPACYGHVTPLGAEKSVASGASLAGAPLDVGKAWREMIHRYLAGALVLLIVLMAALSCTQRFSRLRRRYAFTLLATIVAQAALGMLTVRWQLKPLIVTLHLVIGLSTLSLMWWLWLALRPEGRGVERSLAALYVLCHRRLREMHATAGFVLLALALQLTIGISMVVRGFPLWLATAHNAGAALTLLVVVTLVYRANELAPQSVRVPRRSDSRGTFAIPAAESIPRAAMARANGFAAEVAGVAAGSTAHGPTSFN